MCVRKDKYTANLLKSYRTKPYKFPIHCSKSVSFWGTSYSRPLPIPHFPLLLTPPLLQNPGGTTVNRCVVTVCCKSTRHWLTAVPQHVTQITDGCGIGYRDMCQLLYFRCLQVITADTVIAYITHDVICQMFVRQML